MILEGEPWRIVLSVVTGALGVSALTVALHGFLLRHLMVVERLVFLAGALTLVHAQPLTDAIGVVVLAVAAAVHLSRHRYGRPRATERRPGE